MLTNSIVLAIGGRDTLRPLGIYFKSFANSVRDSKYQKQCSLFITQVLPHHIKIKGPIENNLRTFSYKHRIIFLVSDPLHLS